LTDYISRDIRDQSQSCQISRRILNVFALTNFREGVDLPKIVYSRFHPASRAVTPRRLVGLRHLREDTPTSHEDIDSNTLNFYKKN